MLTFAEERLGPYCTASAMHVCTRSQKKVLKKFLKLSDEERESLIAESDDEIAALEAKAKEEGDAIQAQIKQLTDEHTVRLPAWEFVLLHLPHRRHGARRLLARAVWNSSTR